MPRRAHCGRHRRGGATTRWHADRRAGRRTGQPLEPGSGTAGRIGERHLPSADTHRPHAPRFSEDRHGASRSPARPPSDSAHHGEGRLILLVPRSTGQPFEPGCRLEWPATLQGVEGREHRRPPPGGGVKPAAGHRHNRDRIVGRDRLLEEPISAGTELNFIGRPPGLGERPEEMARFRLDAPPGALAPRRTEEEVAVSPRISSTSVAESLQRSSVMRRRTRSS